MKVRLLGTVQYLERVIDGKEEPDKERVRLAMALLERAGVPVDDGTLLTPWASGMALEEKAEAITAWEDQGLMDPETADMLREAKGLPVRKRTGVTATHIADVVDLLNERGYKTEGTW